MNKNEFISETQKDWDTNQWWNGIKRPYTPEDVWNLRGPFPTDFNVSRLAARKFRAMIDNNEFVNALGCYTGNQAVQCAKAGLKAIYMSGWQLACDGNEYTFPDQGLYSVDNLPRLVRRINNALSRAAQIDFIEGKTETDFFIPTICDIEHGFGSALNAYALTISVMESGVASAHLETQGQNRKCGHLGGKLIVPLKEYIDKLIAVRLAADVAGVPLVIIGRTDEFSATFISADSDPRDHAFIDYSKGRTPEGFYYLKNGIDYCIERAKYFAEYCDLIWMETPNPNIEDFRKFSEGVRQYHPEKKFAYNNSPSFAFKKFLNDDEISKFQKELHSMGVAFNFITLAGWHHNNYGMFKLAKGYKEEHLSAYVKLQEEEFSAQSLGYSGVKHQRESGVGYFDLIQNTIDKNTSLSAMNGSTEHEQF